MVNTLRNSKPTLKLAIWIAAILLLLVGYIHFALMVNMFGLKGRLGILFLLNAIGALVALIAIFTRYQTIGWSLGILVAGGAALAKLMMGSVPGVRQLLMGGPFHGKPAGGGPPNGAGQGGQPSFAPNAGHPGGSGGFAGHAGHFGPPGGHSVLPVFFSIRSLGPISIVLEILFVVLAVYILIARALRSELATPEPSPRGM